MQVVRLGARGLGTEGRDAEKLFTAIRAVANAELAFPMKSPMAFSPPCRTETHEAAPICSASPRRERQIAYLSAARGMKNRDIAQQLTISEASVKRHLQSIFSKTGAKDRLELAVLLSVKSAAPPSPPEGLRWSTFAAVGSRTSA